MIAERWCGEGWQSCSRSASDQKDRRAGVGTFFEQSTKEVRGRSATVARRPWGLNVSAWIRFHQLDAWKRPDNAARPIRGLAMVLPNKCVAASNNNSALNMSSAAFHSLEMPRPIDRRWTLRHWPRRVFLRKPSNGGTSRNGTMTLSAALRLHVCLQQAACTSPPHLPFDQRSLPHLETLVLLQEPTSTHTRQSLPLRAYQCHD